MPRITQLVVRCMFSIARLLRQFWMLALVVACASFWFLIESGGSFADTSRSVLHGLCAQRPTHSFTVGGQLLPFDARMTGIYSGSLACWNVLMMRHRLLTMANPPILVMLLLTGAVGLLAIDGFNALLVDLGRWHPYEPRNVVRFFTGFGTGVALASLQSWLLGSSLWKLAVHVPVWSSLPQLVWAVPVSVVVFMAVSIAPAGAYPIIATALMASAWLTVTGLVLVILVSLLRVESRITTVDRLHVPLAVSAVIALLVILGLAQGRFWLERTLGIPQDYIAMIPGIQAAIL